MYYGTILRISYGELGMSVVEIFSNYWDWYLLISICAIWSRWAMDTYKVDLFITHIFAGLLWPVALIANIWRHKYE